MSRIIIIVAVATLALSLSGCLFLAVTGAGAAGGYVYKEQMDKKDQGK